MMITDLPAEAPTDHHWIFNDEMNQNLSLALPVGEPVITATLDWQSTAASRAYPIGRYRIDLAALEAEGYVRLQENGYLLRFQRTKERIEIAIQPKSKALHTGRVHYPERPGILDGGPGEP